jgi:uncharacterized protein involved in outer membrane biogenesis
MGKAIKILFVGGAIVVIVVIVLVFVVVSNLDKVVERLVETEGTAALGTDVGLEGVEITLTEASGALSGMTVGNPSGFEARNAFELNRIELSIDPSSIGSDEIVLNEVTVDGAHLTYEQQEGGSNLQTILDHLESVTEDSSETDDPLLVIESFLLRAAQVTVIHPELDDPLSLTLPDIALRDVGREGAGATAASAAKQIIGPLLDATIDAAKQRAKEELEARVEQELEDRKADAVDSLTRKLLGND